MAAGPMFADTTFTFVIEEPFERALKRLRAALGASSVKITGELDLATRIRGSLMVSLPPCVVFFAIWPGMMHRGSASDPYGAAVIPIHIVASARGPRTEVHFLKAGPQRAYETESRAFDVVRTFQASLSKTMDRIGRRQLDD